MSLCDDVATEARDRRYGLAMETLDVWTAFRSHWRVHSKLRLGSPTPLATAAPADTYSNLQRLRIPRYVICGDLSSKAIPGSSRAGSACWKACGGQNRDGLGRHSICRLLFYCKSCMCVFVIDFLRSVILNLNYDDRVDSRAGLRRKDQRRL